MPGFLVSISFLQSGRKWGSGDLVRGKSGKCVSEGKDVPVLVGLIGVTAQMLATKAHKETAVNRLTDRSSESDQ